MYVVDNPREREKERDLVSTKVIERVNARYDIQEVQLGKVYKWRPESLLIECECGQRATLTPSGTTCEECAKEHIELVGEALRDQQELRRRLREEELHPWRYAVDSEDEEDPIFWV